MDKIFEVYKEYFKCSQSFVDTFLSVDKEWLNLDVENRILVKQYCVRMLFCFMWMKFCKGVNK